MRNSAGTVITMLSETALPFPCTLCNDALPESGPNLFCDSCLEKLRPFESPTCPGCGGNMDGVLEYCSLCMREDPRLWVGALALFPLAGPARQLIHRFKYRDTPEIARAVGQLGAQRLMESGISPDVIVPTPLHWTRQLQRGFNQADLFCRMLSHFSGIPVKPLLRRVKRTHQQAKLNREQRKKNLSGAFSVKKGANLKKRDILLIDDVMTTGATLHAAAEELAANGAGRIYIMVIARRM